MVDYGDGLWIVDQDLPWMEKTSANKSFLGTKDYKKRTLGE